MTDKKTTNFAQGKRKDIVSPEFTVDGRFKRKIRSFVLRTGRLSQHQQNAMNDHWADYGVDYQHAYYDLTTLFNNANPVVLEIGFGMGRSLVEMAKANPQLNYLGIEVHTPGVGACIANAVDQEVDNLRVICHDAVEVLTDCIPDESLQGLQLFFPDPWHKAKHHKRRIVQREFVDLVVRKLKCGGFIHMATDWENYAEQMLEVLSDTDALANQADNGAFIARPSSRPLTKFEQRGQKLGHGVWDLYFIKTDKRT